MFSGGMAVSYHSTRLQYFPACNSYAAPFYSHLTKRRPSVHQRQNSTIDALEDLFKGVFMQFTAATGLRLTDRIPVIDALL